MHYSFGLGRREEIPAIFNITWKCEGDCWLHKWVFLHDNVCAACGGMYGKMKNPFKITPCSKVKKTEKFFDGLFI